MNVWPQPLTGHLRVVGAGEAEPDFSTRPDLTARDLGFGVWGLLAPAAAGEAVEEDLCVDPDAVAAVEDLLVLANFGALTTGSGESGGSYSDAEEDD